MLRIRLTTVEIVEFLILLMATWAMTPAIKNSISQMYIVFIALGALILIIASMGSHIRSDIALIILLTAFVLTYKLVGVSNETIANHSNMFLYFFTMIASVYLFERLERNRFFKFGVLLTIILLINMIHQTSLYIALGSTSLYHTRDLLNQGISAGTTTFVTVVMLLGMLSATLFFFDISKKVKVFCVLITIFCLFFIFNVITRATALIFIAVYVVACFALGVRDRTSGKSILAFSFVTILFLILFPVVVKLLSNSSSEYFSRKFSAISDFLQGNSIVSESNMGESSLVTRLYVSGISLKTWTSSITNFIFGKGYDTGFYQVTGIGRHSELIDLFPKYGVIGITLFFVTFKSYFKTIKSFLDVQKAYMMLIGFFVLYALFNGVLYLDSGIIINIAIPAILYGFNMDESNHIIYENFNLTEC